MELYLYSPKTSSACGAQLKHRDNFTFLRRRKGQEANRRLPEEEIHNLYASPYH
jgi:hypothetical protein